MAAPTVFANSGHTSGTGALTRTWPASYAVDDVSILFCNREVSTPLAAPNGWTEILDTGLTSAGTTALQLWFRRAETLLEDTNFPATLASGPGKLIRLSTFRGCVTASSPIHMATGSLNSTATTSLSIAGVTTTMSDLLMCYFMTQEVDAITDPFITAGTAADANLGSLTVQYAQSGIQGNGMGTGLVTGTLNTAGASGTLTGTLAASTRWAAIVLGLISTTSSGGGGRNADPDFFHFF